MIRMTLFGIGLVTLIPCAHAATDVIDSLLVDFTPSTLTKAAQRKELEWFRDAAKPFKGKKIMVVSETIDTHKYESEVLAKACLLYTSPSPRDRTRSRMPSSA